MDSCIYAGGAVWFLFLVFVLVVGIVIPTLRSQSGRDEDYVRRSAKTLKEIGRPDLSEQILDAWYKNRTRRSS